MLHLRMEFKETFSPVTLCYHSALFFHLQNLESQDLDSSGICICRAFKDTQSMNLGKGWIHACPKSTLSLPDMSRDEVQSQGQEMKLSFFI